MVEIKKQKRTFDIVFSAIHSSSLEWKLSDVIVTFIFLKWHCHFKLLLETFKIEGMFHIMIYEDYHVDAEKLKPPLYALSLFISKLGACQHSQSPKELCEFP